MVWYCSPGPLKAQKAIAARLYKVWLPLCTNTAQMGQGEWVIGVGVCGTVLLPFRDEPYRIILLPYTVTGNTTLHCTIDYPNSLGVYIPLIPLGIA